RCTRARVADRCDAAVGERARSVGSVHAAADRCAAAALVGAIADDLVRGRTAGRRDAREAERRTRVRAAHLVERAVRAATAAKIEHAHVRIDGRVHLLTVHLGAAVGLLRPGAPASRNYDCDRYTQSSDHGRPPREAGYLESAHTVHAVPEE